jgi:DNA-binding Lrp family transcriptional regulator
MQSVGNMPGSNQPVKAYFMAIVKKGTEHEVAGKLRKLDGVADAIVTYGLYDIVVRIEAQNLGQLDALITEMRKIEEILQTTTLVGA